MGVFDVVGPVMIGPSSSHTAGAARIGLMAREILKEEPKKAVITVYGSFAKTYKGHGTDRALAAGLMGWAPDDLRIPQALSLAKEEGRDFVFRPGDLGSMVHPNTACFQLTGADGRECRVIGSSIGGGQVKVTSIDGFAVELTGVLPALLIPHRDEPGVIALVSSILALHQVNIASMRVFRDNKGGLATMVLECDEGVPDNVVHQLETLDPVHSVRFVDRVV